MSGEKRKREGEEEPLNRRPRQSGCRRSRPLRGTGLPRHPLRHAWEGGLQGCVPSLRLHALSRLQHPALLIS